MGHTRASVIQRANREYRRLDRLVAKLTPAQWKRSLSRTETKDQWTVKDALAHITHWKWYVTLSARGEHRPTNEIRLEITPLNHFIYMRWRKRSPKEVLAWHRHVHKDLLKALREAPSAWFTRKSRGADWPFDVDGHSAEHRVKDIQRALKQGKA